MEAKSTQPANRAAASPPITLRVRRVRLLRGHVAVDLAVIRPHTPVDQSSPLRSSTLPYLSRSAQDPSLTFCVSNARRPTNSESARSACGVTTTAAEQL